MKKNGWFLLLLIAALLLPAEGLALVYPEKSGYVLDGTGLLQEELRQDIDTLNVRTGEAYGGHAYLYVTHFLGGTSAHDFARELFSRWQLSENDFLLVMVIGEETSALKLGDKLLSLLPGDAGDTVMASYFRDTYQSRAYNQAVADVMPQLAQRAARAYQKSLDLSGLFSPSGAVSQTAQTGWEGFITSGDVNWTDYGVSSTAARPKKKTSGLGTGEIVFLAVLAYFLIFSRKKKRR